MHTITGETIVRYEDQIEARVSTSLQQWLLRMNTGYAGVGLVSVFIQTKDRLQSRHNGVFCWQLRTPVNSSPRDFPAADRTQTYAPSSLGGLGICYAIHERPRAYIAEGCVGVCVFMLRSEMRRNQRKASQPSKWLAHRAIGRAEECSTTANTNHYLAELLYKQGAGGALPCCCHAYPWHVFSYAHSAKKPVHLSTVR